MQLLEAPREGTNGAYAAEAAQLAHAARLLHVGSWEWDIRHDQIRWSRELYRIYGLDESFTPTYEAFVALQHPDDREHIASLIESALEIGAPLEFEHRIVRPDGRVRALHCRGEVVREGGIPVRLFGICQDVTERKRIQDEIAITRELALCVDAAASAEEATQAVLARLCRYGGFALGQAWLVADDYLEFSSAWPTAGSSHDPFTSRSRAMTFDAGTGLPGRALATKQAVWIDDVRSDPSLPRAQFARECGLAAGLAVPVPSAERIVAVLEFFASEPRERDDAVADLVARVAAQLGAMLERKRSDEALRGSEERFRLLLESVEDCAIVMLDRAGNVASWNQFAGHVTGHSEAEILGCHVSRLYTPDALAAGEPEQHLRQVAADGRMDHSGWLMRADGLHYRADVTITSLRNGSPTPEGYSYVIRDLTERRRLEQELQRLRVTTTCTQDAIVTATSRGGIVTSWNAGAQRLFGYTEREVVGRPLSFFGAEDGLDLAALLEQVGAAQRPEHRETRAVRKNGGIVDITVTVASIPDAREVTLIARDVTERKRTEQYLERTFGTYIDRDIAEQILREGPALRAREVDVTTMFVDIRGFTAFAEEFRPGEVLETLNCLFELVVPLIAERHGHVDKFVGDGLLAVFGAPLERPDHADLALESACAIARAARETFRGDLEIGIGIDSGTVITGNVGGGGRLDFTVIGDAVNTAARIETATRDTGDTILFSEQTMRRLRRSDLRITPRRCERMKGKRKAVALYTLDVDEAPVEIRGTRS